MSTRDPLENPDNGDKVIVPDGRYREVVERRGEDIVYHCGDDRRLFCSITTWREWCRKHYAVPYTRRFE